MIVLEEQGSPPPEALLVEADPNPQRIQAYLPKARWFQAFDLGTCVAAVVLGLTSPEVGEVYNLAVLPEYRRQGLGRRLLETACAGARRWGWRRLEVGTGNSSFAALALYQLCGFRITAVLPDYYRHHYSAPLFENGLECRDQLRLGLTL